MRKEPDVLDVEWTVVGEPPPRRWGPHWFSVLWYVVFIGGCVAIAASDEDPYTRGGAAFAAGMIFPFFHFLGSVTQRASESEVRLLRQRLRRRGR